MTHAARIRKLKELEKRATIAKLNARTWLYHALNLHTQQMQLAHEGAVRLSALGKLRESIKRIEEIAASSPIPEEEQSMTEVALKRVIEEIQK